MWYHMLLTKQYHVYLQILTFSTEGNREELKKVLEDCPNATDVLFQEDRGQGKTALHWAKSADIAKLLVEAVEPDRREKFILRLSRSKDSAVDLAAVYGKNDVISYLFSVVNREDLVFRTTWPNHGITPLHRAHNAETAKLLIEFIQPCNRHQFLFTKDDRGRTALHWAGLMLKHDVAKYLCSLGQGDKLLLEQDRYGNTALHLTMMDVSMLEVLFGQCTNEKNAEAFLAKLDNKKKTALRMPVEFSDIHSVKYLLSLPYCNDNILFMLDVNGQSDLHCAKTEEIALLLFDHVNNKQAYVTVEDKDGNTAAMHMVTLGQVETLEPVLEYIEFNKLGITQQLETKNHKNQNIFHLACISPKSAAFCELLLTYISEIDISKVLVPDVYNNTPLNYVAARFETGVFAELLLKLPLRLRQLFLLKKNKSGSSCRSIIHHKEFSQRYYLQSVLCDLSSADHSDRFLRPFIARTTFFLENDRDATYFTKPEEVISYDEDLLRVLKYSLNEYSLLDSAYVISHNLFGNSCRAATQVMMLEGSNISSEAAAKQVSRKQQTKS